MPRTRPPALQGTTVSGTGRLSYGLTVRQAEFVGAMLDRAANLDPLKAARAIGVPDGTAATWARLMMAAPAVIKALHAQVEAKVVAAQASPERWLQEVMRVAFTDVRAFYREDGTLKPLTEWTEEMAAAVQEITEDELWGGRGDERRLVGTTKKIKFHAKLQALDMLAKYHKLYADLTVKVEEYKRVDVHTYEHMTTEEATKLYMEQLRGDASAARH